MITSNPTMEADGTDIFAGHQWPSRVSGGSQVTGAILSMDQDVPYSANSSLEHARYKDIERVLEMYTAPNKYEVHNYLLSNQFLVSLLINASFAISKHLPDLEKELHVVVDNEIAGRDKLYIGIQAGGAWKAARGKMQDFNRGWWFGAMPQARGKLMIDVN